MRHVDIRTETVIHRPVARVSAFAIDPDNAPRWYANIESVEWKTDPPLRLRSRVAFVARFLGRRLNYTYEIVELVPQERLVMRTAQGPFPMETTYAFWSLGHDRTRMMLRNRGTPSGFSTFFAPLMTLAIRRENRRDLARLKALLET